MDILNILASEKVEKGIKVQTQEVMLDKIPIQLQRVFAHTEAEAESDTQPLVLLNLESSTAHSASHNQ